jgi:hypothetical protein
MHFFKLILAALFMVPFLALEAKESRLLAKKGQACYAICRPERATECELFAAGELQRYLYELSHARFDITTVRPKKSIVITTVNSLPEEEYRITLQDDTVWLQGGSPRSVLYAVYDFLQRLGCRWVAPAYDFYGGTDRHIPANGQLVFSTPEDTLHESPVFAYRKLYVEEGRTHQTENLKQLIDWMPKVKLNTLVFPIDYEGRGTVKWDNWREELIPELKKRSIQLEVGGHGYQNFIHASMESGTLFEQHPEWFGMEASGQRSRDPRMVICTSNPHAVRYLYANLLNYLKQHPEIEIFDFWPPDSEKWCQCGQCQALGNETERHAMLVNHVARMLRNDLPEVKLECIAYNRYTTPPQHTELDEQVLLDFCPIGQNFEYQLYESGNTRNEGYNKDLSDWTTRFKGDISLYSYYRKYAWRSLPNIIPHYMQNDLKYFRQLGIRGISVYSEPGDWFTYGINHYVFAGLAWNPGITVEALTKNYTDVVYRNAGQAAMDIYTELENIVRYACNIAHTSPKEPQAYDAYAVRVRACRDRITAAVRNRQTENLTRKNLQRLNLILEYAEKSIALMHAKSLNDEAQINQLNTEIRSFLQKHTAEGISIPYKN